MPILRSEENDQVPGDLWPSRRSREAWSALGWLGLAFMILGIADIALGIIPPSFDSTEWVFGTISAVLNGFAIPMTGSFLFLASGIASGTRVQLQITALLLAFLAIALLGMGLLYLTVTPLALDSVRVNPDAYLGMRKAIGKAVVLDVAYTFLHVGGAVKAWMASNQRD